MGKKIEYRGEEIELCCDDLASLLKNNEYVDAEVIWIDEGKFYIAGKIRSADEGNGMTESWSSDQKEINFCPFCGKRIRLNSD